MGILVWIILSYTNCMQDDQLIIIQSRICLNLMLNTVMVQSITSDSIDIQMYKFHHTFIYWNIPNLIP